MLYTEHQGRAPRAQIAYQLRKETIRILHAYNLPLFPSQSSSLLNIQIQNADGDSQYSL